MSCINVPELDMPMSWKQPTYLTKSIQSLRKHVRVLGAVKVRKWHAAQLIAVQTRDVLQIYNNSIERVEEFKNLGTTLTNKKLYSGRK